VVDGVAWPAAADARVTVTLEDLGAYLAPPWLCQTRCPRALEFAVHRRVRNGALGALPPLTPDRRALPLPTGTPGGYRLDRRAAVAARVAPLSSAGDR
jgi:hypothetical protein